MNALQQTNLAIVNQLIGLLKNMNQSVYQQPLTALHGSSVGQHVRHIVEFYQCLAKSLITGTVNYDARERNLQIEQNIFTAIDVLEKSTNFIQQNHINATITLETAFGAEVAAEVPTCFLRELTYLVEHTIHHLAIIKIGLTQTFPEIVIPGNFGVAPSTIHYREKILMC